MCSSQNTSQWTLDYPPFFAHFEFVLAFFAKYFDPQMLQITSQAYTSPQTVFYMRLTVIVADLVYFYACWRWLHYLRKFAIEIDSIHFLSDRMRSLKLNQTSHANLWNSSLFIFTVLSVFHVGHVIVDHIHFQYNGFLNGLLLLSMVNIVEGNIVAGTAWYAILLNFKHIYLYMAPGYATYLLIYCCISKHSNSERHFLPFKINIILIFKLATSVLLVFMVSLLPFHLSGSLMPMLKRLFPFQRGLVHAYWAPNVWALYTALDVILAYFLDKKTSGSSTSGLVQQVDSRVLPTITPTTSLIILLIPLLVSSPGIR